MKNENETGLTDKTIENIADLIRSETEKLIQQNLMSIRLTPDGLIIKESTALQQKFGLDEEDEMEEKLSGVYFKGTHYFDLNSIHFINNTGIAILIDILKSILEMGVEVQFVNVDEKVKTKIKRMGLENLINCKEKTKIEKTVLL
jgi:anti-anti-sigma factor